MNTFDEVRVRKLCERFGDARPRLDRLRHLAMAEWDVKVRYEDIARTVGLDQRTVRMLASPVLRLYNLEAVKRLCWYFGCTPTDLIERLPPAGSPYLRAGKPQLQRQSPPSESFLRRLHAPATLVNRLPDLFAACEENALADALGLDRSTVYRLRTRPGERIGRWTLAAACTFLSMKEERVVDVNELLLYSEETLPTHG